MPYLKATKRKAEIWPELKRDTDMVPFCLKTYRFLKKSSIWENPILPDKEKPFFDLRDDAKNNYSAYSEEWDGTSKSSVYETRLVECGRHD